MTAARKLEFISPEDYLAGEINSPVKHEYWNGRLYAMTGGTNNHALITCNLSTALNVALRGSNCRAYSPDAKIRIRQNLRDTRFYYPDVSVICKSNPGEQQFQDAPVLVAEILSKSTRRQDDGEKREGYQSIPTLQHYLLVEQYRPEIVHFGRVGDEFTPELIAGLDAILELKSLGITIKLADVFEGVTFQPEPDGDEE
jgi:Uma2 family endonuclease